MATTKRTTFRLGEDDPPSPSSESPLAASSALCLLQTAARGSAWGESSDCYGCDIPGEDKVAQFAEFAAEQVKQLVHQLVQRYESDLMGAVEGRSVAFPSCCSSSRVQGSGPTAACEGIGNLKEGDGSSVAANRHGRCSSSSSGHDMRSMSFSNYSQVMHTLLEDSNTPTPSDSDSDDHIVDFAAASPSVADEASTNFGANRQDDSGGVSHSQSQSQTRGGQSASKSERNDHSNCDSATGGDSTDFSAISSTAARQALPAWVALSRGLWKGSTFIEKEKQRNAIFTRFQSFFVSRPSTQNIRMIVSPLRSADKDRQRRFECFFAFFYFLNALFVCWELQYFATGEAVPLYSSVISACFTVGFTMELLLRFRMVRYSWYEAWVGSNEGFWNVVDALVLVCLWSEHVWRFALADPARDAPTWLVWNVSLLRAFRFAELMSSLCNRMTAFREIRLLFQGAGIALRSWAWILIFTALISYIFSIFLAHGTYPLCNPTGGSYVLEEHTKLCEHFATVEQTFFTCYKATFGGLLWGDLVEAMQPAPLGYQILFVVFVAFGVIIIANLAAGVLIEVHANGKRHDIECMIAEEEKETSLFIEAMQEIFREMDTNKSGELSKEELAMALQDPKMNALLRCYKLEMHDATLLFDLLDSDKSGLIDIEEFIAGCLKMKGTAQAVDIVRLQIQMKDVHNHVARTHEGRAGLKCYSMTSARQLSYAKVDSPASRVKKCISHASTASKRLPGAKGGSRALRPSSGQPRSVSVAVRGRKRESITSNISNESHMLSKMVPTWSGCRIQKAEERAMLLSELRFLRDHIQLHASTWIDEKTRREHIHLRRVNMYQVNYNWICPLTVPEGVTLQGLNLRPWQVAAGTLLTQEPSSKGAAPRAIAEVLATADSAGLKLRVLRGKFDTAGDVTCEGTSVGVPTSVEATLAMSYKELVGTSPTMPTWYCCHWWGEPIIDFISCIEEHGKLRKCDSSAAYWICAFANSQHDLGYELSNDPETSSFRRAMRTAHGVLLVLDSDATPFQRIWCDYELYTTVLDPNKVLDIVTMSKTGNKGKRQPHILADLPEESAFKKTKREACFPISALAKGMCAKLEDGDATVPTDKLKILTLMQKEIESNRPWQQIAPDDESGMLSSANRELNAFFAWCAWPQALKNGVVRNFGANKEEGGIDLAEVTAQEDGRKSLRISLAHFQEVTDSALADIAAGLPASLVELALSFEGCVNITDKGLSYLTRGLQKTASTLTTLRLDFLGCKQITDLGVKALALALPPGLQRLRLDFALCRKVGYVGATCLAQSLPSCLHEFSCTFKGTLVDENFGSLDEFLRRVKALSGSSVTATSTRFKLCLQ